MTQPELEALVKRIGDEFAAQLGVTPAAPNGKSNGYSTSAGAAGLTASAPAAGGESVVCDWSPPAEGVAGLIDHTLLSPEASPAEVTRLCGQAREFRFASVCVQPNRVAQAVRELRGSGVKVCSVIGFPHGATLTPVKRAEAEQVLKLGAAELDMVADIGALVSGDLDRVHSDICGVVELARGARAAVKVILETAFLEPSRIVEGCAVAKVAGADFVKTSTGFAAGGAEPAHIALMHRAVGGELGIKAAGGIRNYARFLEMMRAGATRIGTSAGVEIVSQAR